MKSPTAVVLLPYAVSILLKLSSAILDKKLASQTLQSLAMLLKPPSQPSLTSDQQAVIVDHLAHVSLKTTAVLTTFTSTFAAIVIVRETEALAWVWWIFIALLLLGFLLLWWILPRQVHYFSEDTALGVERGAIAIGAFCLYDFLLAAISCFANLRSAQAP